MKLRIVAISLLVALGGFIFPFKTAAENPVTIPEVKNDTNNQRVVVPVQPSPKVVDTPEPTPKAKTGVQTGWHSTEGHSTKAEKQISEDQLKTYLENKGSPLAPYASRLLESPYWSTIIGICTIEQYGCTKAPGNNYWGIGPGIRYKSIPEGIDAISTLLAKYDTKGKDTIEELNGYYVQPASSTWFNTVLQTKLKLENL